MLSQRYSVHEIAHIGSSAALMIDSDAQNKSKCCVTNRYVMSFRSRAGLRYMPHLQAEGVAEMGCNSHPWCADGRFRRGLLD